MNSLETYLQKRLEKRKETGLLRGIKPSLKGVDFVSNDYLGIAQTPLSISVTKSRQLRGSRNLVGSSAALTELEEDFAHFFRTEACMVLPSGYQANLALLLTVATPKTTILFDEHVHNSLRRAIQLTGAKALKIKHNNTAHLKQRLENASGNTIVICESLYSMHGDFCSIKEWSALCEEHQAWLWVDEAHTAGWYGKQGRGVCMENNLDIPLISVGLGKAMGTQGGLILGSKSLMQSVVNFGDPAIYSTAISDTHIQELAQRLEDVKAAQNERATLLKNIAHYQEKAKHLKGYQHSESPIQTVVIGNPEQTTALAKALANEQLNVAAVRYPTVPKGSDLLRMSLHSYNTAQEIEHLIKTIEEYV